MSIMRIRPLCEFCQSYDGPNHSCRVERKWERLDGRESGHTIHVRDGAVSMTFCSRSKVFVRRDLKNWQVPR